MSTSQQDFATQPRILVPLDGSPFAEYALPLAAALARARGAELELARVHLPSSVLPMAGDVALPVYTAEWDRESRQASHAYLTERAARLKASHGVGARPVMLEGRIAEAIDAHAAEHGVEFIVTTTHGRGGFSRIVQGSVVDELIRVVEVPVLALRPRDGGAPPTTLRKLLVPLDGSELSARAIGPARALARLLDASVVLLSVITPSQQMREPVLPPSDEQGQPDADPLAAEAERMLHAAARDLEGDGLAVEIAVVVAPDPAEAIVREAEARGADCIAMATHGRSGLTRLLFGSVADRVFRSAPQAVLLHRAVAADRSAVEAAMPAVR